MFLQCLSPEKKIASKVKREVSAQGFYSDKKGASTMFECSQKINNCFDGEKEVFPQWFHSDEKRLMNGV